MGARVIARVVARSKVIWALFALSLLVVVASSAAVAHAAIPDVVNDPVIKALFPVSELRDLTGYNGARTYLFIGQNSYELRPTGGFISRIGLLRFVNGDADFAWMKYAYDLDDRYKTYLTTHPSEREPEPYEYWPFAHNDTWYFRDKNWWPDFRVTARQLQTKFAVEGSVYNASVPASEAIPLAQPFAVDGVIAFDESLGSSLLGALGPITLSAPGQPFNGKILNSQNFGLFSQWWETNQTTSQRGFFDATARAIRSGIAGASGDKQSQLAMAFIRALSERHIQVYSNSARNQAALEKLNWAGKSPSLPGDFLHVSDFNIGGPVPGKTWRGNKVNMYVRRGVDYRLALDTSNVASSALTVSYYNAGLPGYFNYIHDPNSPIPNYSIFENVYYRAWCRAFVPRAAVLTTATYQQDLRNVDDTMTGRRYYGSWVGYGGLEAGSSQKVVYRYTQRSVLLPVANGYLYRLQVQKQGGTDADAVSFQFTTPYLWITSVGGLVPTTRTQHAVTFTGDMKYDKVMDVRLAPVIMSKLPTKPRARRQILLRGLASQYHVRGRGTWEVWRKVRGSWKRLVRRRMSLVTYQDNVKEFSMWYRIPAKGTYRVRGTIAAAAGLGATTFGTGYVSFVAR